MLNNQELLDTNDHNQNAIFNSRNQNSKSNYFKLNDALEDIRKNPFKLPLEFSFIHSNCKYLGIIDKSGKEFILILNAKLHLLPYSSENKEKRDILLSALGNDQNFTNCILRKDSYIYLPIKTKFSSKELCNQRPTVQKIIETISITLLDNEEKTQNRRFLF